MFDFDFEFSKVGTLVWCSLPNELGPLPLGGKFELWMDGWRAGRVEVKLG